MRRLFISADGAIGFGTRDRRPLCDRLGRFRGEDRDGRDRGKSKDEGRIRHTASGRIGPARILIVEDEFLIAMESESILMDAGHEVVGVAADEQQALSLAEQARPDLVLMDIRLARAGDGIEVAKAIRARCGIRSLRIRAWRAREP